MNLFRNLLFWLLLAVAGVLAAQLLAQGPARVLVRFRGTGDPFTVVRGWLMRGAAVRVAWLLWPFVMLPRPGWRGCRARQARARLTDGLTALQQGHWSRA